MRLLCTLHDGLVVFVAWFMGFEQSFMFTFFYWHLEDLNLTPTFFGGCSVPSHVSELILILATGLLNSLAKWGFYILTWLIIHLLYLCFLPGKCLDCSPNGSCSRSDTCGHMTSLHFLSQCSSLQDLHLGLGRDCVVMIRGLLVNYFGVAATV